jgi:hypothetical protein
MNPPLKTGVIAGIGAIVAAGAIEAAFTNTENDFFQFCTTKAYGWPAPWRIDYCECEGAKTIYPTTSKIENLSAIAACGITGFALFGGISLLQRRQKLTRAEQAADGKTPEAQKPPR